MGAARVAPARWSAGGRRERRSDVSREIARIRILEEVQRIQSEVHNCAHCQSLKAQAVRLLEVMPPAPFVDAQQRQWTYTGPWPDEMVTQRIAEVEATVDALERENR
jgi:hypothetical protein